jgi:hypothetical protein
MAFSTIDRNTVQAIADHAAADLMNGSTDRLTHAVGILASVLAGTMPAPPGSTGSTGATGAKA